MLACLVVLFAYTGPFGTYDSIDPLGRFGYWALALGANWLVCGSTMMLVIGRLRAASGLARALAIAGVAVVAAVPGTGIVFTAEMLFRPGYSSQGAVVTIYLAVAILMMVIGSLSVTLFVRRETAGLAAEPQETAESGRDVVADYRDRFLDRLPPDLGRDLVCLKTADHYVEAFTTSGSALILMRFSDAVSELDGADGLQVHRSYWVARAHVTAVVRRKDRTILRLTGDHEVPVSRGYLAAVRAAGLA